MQADEHIQDLSQRFAVCVEPAPPPFCLQSGHKDAVARGERPEFGKRTQRGEEPHAYSYLGAAFLAWFPSLVIFGTVCGLIGRAIGGDTGFHAGLIVGALVVPVGLIYGVITGLREVRQRKELYTKGRLLQGFVTGLTATDHYWSDQTNPDSMPERSGAFHVYLGYRFVSPTGKLIEANAQGIHQDRPQPWPDLDTPVVILYLDDERYEVL